jgi:benzoyl-CoA reductase/2-hydroxyglutaryl-CoA dehydratase subunit BcrC/BadD/HgdB
LTTAFFCDQAAEVDELIHRVYDVPVVYTDRPMVADWDRWPDMEEREDRYLADTIGQAFEEAGKIIDHEITEEDQGKGTNFLVTSAFAHNALCEYKKDKDPCPLSMNDSFNYAFLGAVTAMRRSYTDNAITNAHNLLLEELKERVENGKGVTPEGAPRVVINIPNWVDASLSYMIEKEVGIAIPISHYEYFIDKEIPHLISMQDVGYNVFAARVMLAKGIFHSTYGLIDYTKDLCEAGNCDGFLWEYPISCRPLAITPYMVKKIMEEEYDIPVLALEGDKYDSRFYSPEQQRSRIETFGEILRERRRSKQRL